jgi:O-antigen ligase
MDIRTMSLGSRSERRPTRTASRRVALLVFLGLMVLVALFGGSARAEQAGVLALRPTAVLVLAFAFWKLSRAQWLSILMPAWFLLALGGLIAVQLVPLPPGLWSLLPGRDAYLETFAAVGIDPPWLPISQFPVFTWNSLVCLVVPLAVLFAWAVLPPQHRAWAMPVLIGLGLISALLGFVQLLSGGTRSLYLYSISNFGSNCGLFANRNHQAVFQAALLVLVPMARKDLDRGRLAPYALNIVAIAAIALLILSIFTTGSRVGFVVGLIATAWAAWRMHQIVDDPTKPKVRRAREKFKVSPRTQKLLIPVFLALLAATALLTPHSMVLDRLLATDGATPIEDMRVDIFKNTMVMIPDNLPFGGGAGTFPEVYKGYEHPDGMSFRYVNHAHDDLLEFVYEFGIPGALLFVLGLVLVARWFLAARRSGPAPRECAEALGLALLIILLGSLFDYPARTPIIASLTILALASLYELRLTDRPAT